jgi:hypothetical protein
MLALLVVQWSEGESHHEMVGANTDVRIDRVAAVRGVRGAVRAVINGSDRLAAAGQGVRPWPPVFEGWSPNPDGTFRIHFGYMNRNHRITVIDPENVPGRLQG